MLSRCVESALFQDKDLKNVKHRCSLCGTIYDFIWEEGTPLPKNFPFCSARCKASDLAKWMNEEYTIGTALPDTVLSEAEQELLAELAKLGANIDDESA